LFYFFVDDLAAAIQSLQDAGAIVTHVGYPPHALGGEAKTVDPDGNTILLGSAEPVGRRTAGGRRPCCSTVR
jgi:predicted enzyme related to lactoylglutathione lyase